VKFLILGSTGMAGHLITTYLRECGHEVYGLSRRKIFPHVDIVLDVTRQKELAEIIFGGNFDCIVNCVGILNRAAEKHKTLAIKINSELPYFLAEMTIDLQTKIIQLSTDCVFSGKRGSYCENAFPDGLTFYDRTKALGELVDEKNITFRNSIIGPDLEPNGIGLLNWFLQQTETINGYTKSIWSGVTTLYLAQMIERAMVENFHGLYQLTNNTPITKHELLNLFAKIFHKDIKILPVEGVVADKTLINTKNFGVAPTYEKMLVDLRNWMLRHKNFYSHYGMENSN